MLKIIERIVENVPKDILTDDILMNLWGGSPDRRYGVIKRAIAKGELIHIRQGSITWRGDISVKILTFLN